MTVLCSLLLIGDAIIDNDFTGSESVPEPNSILLLAAGAAGLGLWRRRRAG